MTERLTSFAAGHCPPVVRFVASEPLARCERILVEITCQGVRGVATFRWLMGRAGEEVLQEKHVLTGVFVPLGSTGVSLEFTPGVYNTTHYYVRAAVDASCGRCRKNYVGWVGHRCLEEGSEGSCP